MEPETRPNILLVLMDSAQAQVFGAYGGRCRTPAADRLAAEGVRFTHALTTAPICHPARASLATGLLPHAHGFIANRCGQGAYPFNVFPGVPTISEALAQAGYRCGYAGQGHIDVVGFHDDRSVPTARFVSDLAARGLAERAVPEHTYRGCGRVALSLEDARDTQFADAALGLLDTYADRPGPWFIQCDFDGPHPPCWVPEPFDRLHALSHVRVPESFRDSLDDKPTVHRHCRSAQGTGSWTEADWRVFTVHYYGMVSMIDSLVGRLLDRLDELGQSENTLVVLTSDHGGMCGAHGLLCHGTPAGFREVMEVPLLARWPALFPGRQQVEGMVSHLDLAPSLAECAGAAWEAGPHSRSWVALAEGAAAADWPEAVGGQFHGSGVSFHSVRMLRTERWSYVWHPFAGEELYDLQSDRYETANLAGRSTAGPVQWEMRRMLGEYMRAADDPLGRSAQWRKLESA